jgi:asparagine synthase (glutamine-hydrolysing)
LDESQTDSRLKRHVESTISDADYADGRRRFKAYGLNSKEELFYIQKLASVMDIARVPHLAGRLTLDMPNIGAPERLKDYMA